MSVGRVLVVDDEAAIRQAVRLILAKADYDVVEAENGEQAMKVIKSGDNPRTVDVIICDLYMPKVDGAEAIAYFCSEFPSIPVIVLTGKPEVPSVVSLFKQGVVEYLSKPVTPEGLRAAVANAMRHRQQLKDRPQT